MKEICVKNKILNIFIHIKLLILSHEILEIIIYLKLLIINKYSLILGELFILKFV